MSLGHGASVVKSGLVLHLDAANSRNFSLNNVEVLVVAGGGGAGGSNGSWGGGGGGGAGGIVYQPSFTVVPGTQYTVVVGAGGAGGNTADAVRLGAGYNGSDSTFSTITAIGGGGGGNGGSVAGVRAGYSGGSGGGAGYNVYNYQAGSSGTAGQGNAGGNVLSNNNGAGGGGAGGVGGNTANGGTTPGFSAGGIGATYVISGSAVVYSTGGAGTNPSVSTPVTSNSGNGGNGTYAGSPGGSGSSGIVIIRYKGPQRAIGGTVTTLDNYTIHTFTTVGSFTFTPISTSSLLGISDMSGNGKFGTTFNGPVFTSSKLGGITFDGIDDYLTFPALLTTDAEREGNLTYEYWIEPTQQIYSSFTESLSGTAYYNPGTVQGLAGNTSYKYTDMTYAAFMFAFGTNGFVAGVHNNGYAPPILVDYKSYTGISHLVVVKNVYGCSYYINGVFKKTSQVGTKILGDVFDRVVATNESLYFGKYFKGNIYSVKLYNRALSSTEIKQNFEAFRGRYGI